VKSKQRIPFSENDLHHVAGRPDIAATTALLRFVSLIAVLTPPPRARVLQIVKTTVEGAWKASPLITNC
jgi:hypothetical protein